MSEGTMDDWFVVTRGNNIIVSCRRGDFTSAYAITKEILDDLEEYAVEFAVTTIMEQLNRHAKG